MIYTLRLIPPIIVVSLVLLGVSELLYRGWVGARARWKPEPELVFELYTFGLPPETGDEVSRLFCGRLEDLPIVVSSHDEEREFRGTLLYRRRKRPAAAFVALPVRQREKPHTLEPLIRRSLLWSALLKPVAEVSRQRRRLLLETRAQGALPILAGSGGEELSRELEVPAARGPGPADLATALGELRGEKPRCLSSAAEAGKSAAAQRGR